MTTERVPKFVHIAAAGNSGALYALDVEGRVWQWVAYGWSRLTDAVAPGDVFA